MPREANTATAANADGLTVTEAFMQKHHMKTITTSCPPYQKHIMKTIATSSPPYQKHLGPRVTLGQRGTPSPESDPHKTLRSNNLKIRSRMQSIRLPLTAAHSTQLSTHDRDSKRHQRLTPPQIYLRNGPEMKALMHLTRLLHPRNSPCQHVNAGKPQECAHVPHDRNRGMNASLTNHAAASVRIARQYTGKRISRDVAELVRAVVDVLQVCVHVRPAAQRDMIFWTGNAHVSLAMTQRGRTGRAT